MRIASKGKTFSQFFENSILKGAYMWILTAGLVSVILTVALIAVALFSSSSKKDEEAKNKNFSEDSSIWRKLGFIDETPNLIRAVVAGDAESGPILYYTANVRGKKIDKKGRLTHLEDEEDQQSGLNPFQLFTIHTFGKRWIGLPFFRNVKPIDIDRVVKKDTQDADQEKLKLSGVLGASKKTSYGLYAEFPRPTYHHELDTNDQVRFNIISTAIVVVEDAEQAFTIYNDSLLQNISDIIETFISNKVLKMNWENYKNEGSENQTGKTGTEKFAKSMDDLNCRLSPLGVIVKHLFISDPEISKGAEEMQKALEATRIAKERANAKSAEADGEGRAIERIATAKADRYRQLVEFYKAQGVSAPEAVVMANSMVSAEFNAEAIGKLNVYVAGGSGVQLTLPEGGKK